MKIVSLRLEDHSLRSHSALKRLVPKSGVLPPRHVFLTRAVAPYLLTETVGNTPCTPSQQPLRLRRPFALKGSLFAIVSASLRCDIRYTKNPLPSYLAFLR